MNKINVSFVTIEYNCLNELRSCIQSIHSNCADASYEIIVSSNSSYSSETRTAIRNEFQNIKWIFNNKNLGFAKALNIGISNSSGSCIVIINPDAKICDGSIVSAYKYLKTNPDVGIIGPRIIDKSGNLQDSCRHFMTPLNLLIRIAKRFLFKQEVLLNPGFNYDKIQPVDWVIGAFMILRNSYI